MAITDLDPQRRRVIRKAIVKALARPENNLPGRNAPSLSSSDQGVFDTITIKGKKFRKKNGTRFTCEEVMKASDAIAPLQRRP